MNKLKSHKQEMVIAALVEGSSIRSTERMTGVHRDTITRLMLRVGNACQDLTHLYHYRAKNHRKLANFNSSAIATS